MLLNSAREDEFVNLKLKLFFVILLVVTCLTAFSQGGSVRLALVNVPDELLKPLLPDFQKQTGLRAEIVYTGSDPFSAGREGKAELWKTPFFRESWRRLSSIPRK
jgi:hypothetical protein